VQHGTIYSWLGKKITCNVNAEDYSRNKCERQRKKVVNSEHNRSQQLFSVLPFLSVSQTALHHLLEKGWCDRRKKFIVRQFPLFLWKSFTQVRNCDKKEKTEKKTCSRLFKWSQK